MRKKILIAVLAMLIPGYVCISQTQIYNVTTTTWDNGTTSSFYGAMNAAVNYYNSNPGSNVEVRLQIVGGGFVMLTTPLLGPMTLNGSGTFTIKNGLPGSTQGINASAYGGANYTLDFGIFFASATAANIVIDGINFESFNGNANNNGVCTVFNNCLNVTIQNCKFKNFLLGVWFSKVENMKILSNVFEETITSNGWNMVGIGRDAIVMNETTVNTRTGKAEVAYNTFTKVSGGAYQDGAAVLLQPCQPSSSSSFYNGANIDVKFEANVHHNTISKYTNGVTIGHSPYNRTSDDLTFKADVNNNNFNYCHINAVGIGSPYRHFNLENNTFTTDASVYGSVIQLGSVPVEVISNNYVLLNFAPNKFGFDMAYPNSLGITAKNNTNTYTSIQFPGQVDNQRIVVANDITQGVNMVGLNIPGHFEIYGGKFSNIRECTNNQQSPIYNPPINLLVPTPYFNPSNPSTPLYLMSTPGNGAIAKPVIAFAKVRATDLKTIYTLSGNHINTTEGPYSVEFFKADNLGNLSYFLGRTTVNVVSGNTFTTTIPYAPGSNLQPGDRIGMTVTSLGTVGYPTNTWGTSEVAYYTTCGECISDFAPEPGKTYVLGAWIKGTPSSGNLGNVEVQFLSAINPDVNLGSAIACAPNLSELPIDGWRKIEKEFTVPVNAVGLKLRLNNLAQPNQVLFDDIRIHPKDAMEKSYVYDPESMRLMAELDERNYATLYEYDEEGKLIRVKKETEKGVMTIKESRNGKPIK